MARLAALHHDGIEAFGGVINVQTGRVIIEVVDIDATSPFSAAGEATLRSAEVQAGWAG